MSGCSRQAGEDNSFPHTNPTTICINVRKDYIKKDGWCSHMPTCTVRCKDVVEKCWNLFPHVLTQSLCSWKTTVDSHCRPREDNTRPCTRLLLHPEDFMRWHCSPKHNGSVSVRDRARGAPVRWVYGFPIESTWHSLPLVWLLPNGVHACHKVNCVVLVLTYDRGEPAVSDTWTGWVWEITGWSSRLQENYCSF